MEFEKTSSISNTSTSLGSDSSCFEIPGNPNPSPSPSPFPFPLPPTLNNLLHLYQSNEQIDLENKRAKNIGAHHACHNSEATLVTTKALAATSTGHLCVNGATMKASKKRSRASRRAPTALLRTDTSNFRAMVQQFTGIPHVPFASTPSQGSSFSSAAHLTYPNSTHPSQQYSSLLSQDDMNSTPFLSPGLFLSKGNRPLWWKMGN